MLLERPLVAEIRILGLLWTLFDNLAKQSDLRWLGSQRQSRKFTINDG
jgi:hypothetical protein